MLKREPDDVQVKTRNAHVSEFLVLAFSSALIVSIMCFSTMYKYLLTLKDTFRVFILQIISIVSNPHDKISST